MQQNCQVKFDDNKRILTVTLKTNDVAQKFTLSYDDMKRGLVQPLISSRAHRLTYKEFKKVSNEIAIRFKVDPKSKLPWSEQFCLVLGHVAGVLHPQNRILSSDEKMLIKMNVRNLNQSLCDSAVVGRSDFSEAITAGYCGGVDSMFCTDDYITIRKGNTIIARVGLSGNDYTELKEFYDRGVERILSRENIANLAEAVRQMKMDKAMELAGKKGSLAFHNGLKLEN